MLARAFARLAPIVSLGVAAYAGCAPTASAQRAGGTAPSPPRILVVDYPAYLTAPLAPASQVRAEMDRVAAPRYRVIPQRDIENYLVGGHNPWANWSDLRSINLVGQQMAARVVVLVEAADSAGLTLLTARLMLPRDSVLRPPLRSVRALDLATAARTLARQLARDRALFEATRGRR